MYFKHLALNNRQISQLKMGKGLDHTSQKKIYE